MSKGAISNSADGKEYVQDFGMLEHPLKWVHLAAICRFIEIRK